MRVFVNEQAVEVAPGATVADAVARVDPALGVELQAGRAFVRDGVGRRLDASSVLRAGAILRVRAAQPTGRDPGAS